MIENKISIKNILLLINIGNDMFWEFLNDKIRSYPLQVHEFGWGCFPITDDEDMLVDIRVLVPNIVDEGTLLVNIHEFAHAFELYNKLGKKYEENVHNSEKYAREKEAEYLKLVKKESIF